MQEKSYYRQGIEHYLLVRGLYSANEIDSFSDEELYSLYENYVKEKNIEKESKEYLDWWFFSNR